MTDIATELQEIAEDLGFVANTITGYRAREIRGYVTRLTELSRRVDEESK